MADLISEAWSEPRSECVNKKQASKEVNERVKEEAIGRVSRLLSE